MKAIVAPRAGPATVRDYAAVLVDLDRMRATLEMLLRDRRAEALGVAIRIGTLSSELLQAVRRRELERKARR